jgi:hypothetical protein
LTRCKAGPGSVLKAHPSCTISSPRFIHSRRTARPRQTGDQAHLCIGKCFAERCVGPLDFGDLVLQSVDFHEEHGDVVQTKDAGIAWIWVDDYGGVDWRLPFAAMTLQDKLVAWALSLMTCSPIACTWAESSGHEH